VEKFITNTNLHNDPSSVERELLQLSMYRPLSHLKGFEAIAGWDMTQFSSSLREVLAIHVLDPIEQRRMVEDSSSGAVVISPISAQNARVGEFYTTRITITGIFILLLKCII